MARPRKQEVDYFPHYCDHGKVLFILENHFKNDGYAVFYKLEELLARTEGHCYDCSKLENWEYLLSKMGTTEEIVVAIIKKLSAMGVIDEYLWEEKRIWMQSFIESITDAYARRKVNLPTRPELMSTINPVTGINDNNNPQSKVKKSKVKKSKEEIENATKNLFHDSVYLSDDEYQKLLAKYGQEKTNKAIEILNNGIMSKGYKYKSHYHALLGWPMKEVNSGGNRNGTGTFRSTGAPYPQTGRGQDDRQGGLGIPKEYKPEHLQPISEEDRERNLKRLSDLTK